MLRELCTLKCVEFETSRPPRFGYEHRRHMPVLCVS